MDRRQLLFGMTALALSRNFPLHFVLSPQDSEPTGQPKNLSVRERAGLRGPVETCVGGTTTTEYDPDGRMLSTHAVEPDGREWGSTQTYDSSGRLLRISSRNWDGSSTVQIYSYDEAGRLVGIADGTGDRTDFRYDKQGRKMSVQSFAPKPPKEGAVGVDLVSGSVFEAARSGVGVPGVPEGGSVTTLYNESDQATEVQIRDDKGSVVSRVIRTYGANGQPSEEKEILENLAPLFLDGFPTEVRAKFGPAQIKAMNKGLITFMGGGGETSYTYDAQNRITETHLRILFFETVTTIAYNDHGDIAEERRTLFDYEVI